MVFDEVLREIAAKVQGVVGLVVMGMDGIPIEKLALDKDVNFDLLATECTAILRSSRHASEGAGAGRLREIVVMTEALVVLAQAITDDYVLLGAVRRGAPYGRARFYMRRATSKLEREFV